MKNTDFLCVGVALATDCRTDAFHYMLGSLGEAEQESLGEVRPPDRTHVSVHATYLPSILPAD